MTAPTLRRRPPARHVLRALIDLVWTTATLVGAPIALATIFGSPLPTSVPDASTIGETTVQLIDPQVLTNVLVCVAWVIWAVVITYVLVDTVDVARGVGRRVRRVWPGSLVAAKFVASIVVLVALLRPTGSASALPRPVPVEMTAQAAPTSTVVVTPAAGSVNVASGGQAVAPVSAEAETTTYTVVRGDTLWDIAERKLGDPFRWPEIQQLNADQLGETAGRPQLQPGSIIHLPAVSPTTIISPATTYTVQPGDTLWDIAEDELGDPTRWDDIADANSDVITRPELVQPGWDLDLPAQNVTASHPTPPAAPQEPRVSELPVPESGSTTHPAPSSPVEPSAPPAATTPTTTNPTVNAPAASAPSVPPTPSWAPAQSTTTVPLWMQARGFETVEAFEEWARQNPENAPAPAAAAAGEDPGAVAAPDWALRGAVPVLLAAGVAVALTRRRRRVLAVRPPKAPAPRRDPELVPTEMSLRQLVEDSAGNKIRWIDAVLRYLNVAPTNQAGLCLVRPTDPDLELLWSKPPVGGVPAGFAIDDDGHGWRVATDEAIDDIERQAEGRAPIAPALVTIGDTTAGPALANLAAITPLAVTGDPESIERWLAGVDIEITAQPWSQDVCFQPQRATEQASAGVLIDLRIDAETGRVTVATRELVDPTAATWNLDIQADRARLRSSDERFDLPLTPVGVDPDDARRFAGLLVEAAIDPYQQPLTALDDRPAEPVPAPVPASDPRSAADLATAEGIALPEPPRFDDLTLEQPVTTTDLPDVDDELATTDTVEPAAAPVVDPVLRLVPGPVPLSAATRWEPRAALRVLGRPNVAGALMHVQPKPLALLSYLALARPDHPHRGQVINTVWGGDAGGRKNMNTAITRLRKAFGDDNLITVDAAGHYSVTDELDSDWEQFQRLARRADHTDRTERLGLLRDALALVAGAPFADCDDKTFGWVSAEMRTQMEIAIHDTADTLASEAVAAGHGQLAVWAARQGLKGCPYVTGLFAHIFQGHALRGDQAAFEATWREVQAADDLVPSDVVDTYQELRRQLVGS